MISALLSGLVLTSAAAAEVVRPASVLEEVVITASLRREPAISIPASVTVLDGQILRDAGQQHLQDVLSLVPNLNWASGTSRPRYFQIRGVGETEQWQGAPNPSVGVLIDGMDFSGIGMPAAMFDVEQLDVLRGPQATAIGANALAGLLSLSTRAASREPDARLQFTSGSYGDRSGAGAIGGAIGSEAAYRLSAQVFRSDGFRDNAYLGRDDTNGFDETTVRGKLALLQSERMTVKLAALWSDVANGFDAFSVDNSRTTLSDRPGRDAQRSRGLSMAIDVPAGLPVEIRSVTSWTDADIAYSFDGDWGNDPSYDFAQDFRRSRRTISQDLRALSRPGGIGGGRASWVAGVYALDIGETNAQLDFEGGQLLRPALSSRYQANSAAVYGQFDVHFAGQWRGSIGLRGEQRDARYRDSEASAFESRDRMLGGHLAVDYRPDARRSGYLTLSRGYKAGGFNIGALVPEARRQFAPELLYSAELGVRVATAGGRANLRAAVFWMDRSEQQVSTSLQLDPGDPLSFIFITDNAARGENRGVEVTAQWQPAARWRFEGAAGLLDSQYRGYRIGNRTLDGREQAHAPQYQLTLAADYRRPDGLFARVDLQSVDNFYFSDTHDQRSRAYSVINLRAGVERDRWGASLWIRNALDRAYSQRGFFFGNEPPDFPDKLYLQQGDPRRYGATVWMQLR